MEIKKDPIKKRNSEPTFNYSAWVARRGLSLVNLLRIQLF
jgi:hypothetical protein